MPDTVKYGISYLTVIGARLSSDSCSNVRHTVSSWREHVNGERLTAADAGESEVRAHEELTATTELLDLPHKRGLVGYVLHATGRCLCISVNT